MLARRTAVEQVGMMDDGFFMYVEEVDWCFRMKRAGWKIMFMPDELGTWSFAWNFSDGKLNGNGSFKAVDDVSNPRKPGPLKHDPNINQWLVSADGSRYVFLNMFGNNYKSPPSIYADSQFHINMIKENGFDVLMSNGPSAGGNRPLDETSPFGWTDKNNYIPRMQGWRLLENGLFKILYEENIYFYDWSGFYAGNGWITLHTKPRAFQDKVIKYWLARTAPYFFYIYNIGFELPEYVDIPSWSEKRAKFIKAIDPWDHLVTGHELHGWSYAESAVIDFSALQNDGLDKKERIKGIFKSIIDWSDGNRQSLRGVSFHDIALMVWNSPSAPHPHCNECIWNAKWQEPGTEASHRKDLWDGITGGMSYAFYMEDSSVGLAAFRHANAFLKSGVKWWTMSPHDEVMFSGNAFVLANIGVEYIVYSYAGDNFRVELPAGNYQKQWFNPAIGTYEKINIFESDDSSVKFDKPDEKDWVLHIKAMPEH